MTLRIPNAGDAAVTGKGPAGDLLVRVNVAASKMFRRQGVNLYHEARIPLHTALLGGRVRVPTLDGEVDVRIPGGTQQGEEMVLKERGVIRLRGGGKGDLFVTFAVQLPRSVAPIPRDLSGLTVNPLDLLLNDNERFCNNMQMMLRDGTPQTQDLPSPNKRERVRLIRQAEASSLHQRRMLIIIIIMVRLFSPIRRHLRMVDGDLKHGKGYEGSSASDFFACLI
jgi:DnaJ-class molecular chaperone